MGLIVSLHLSYSEKRQLSTGRKQIFNGILHLIHASLKRRTILLLHSTDFVTIDRSSFLSMTMAIDNQQRFGGMNFDHMSYPNPPQFTNPWTATSSPSQNHSLYASSHSNLHPNLGLDIKHEQQPQAPRMNSTASMGSYASVPISAASADLLSPSRSVSTGYGDNHHPYSSAPSPAHNAYAPTPTPYETMGYAPAPVRSTYAIQQDNSRRLSQPGLPNDSTRSF